MNEQSARRGIHFDPSFNLGQVVQIVTLILVAASAYFSLDNRVSVVERDQRSAKADHKEMVVNAETRLLQEINRERARLDQTQVRTSDDIREIKVIVRDGFRDLDAKMERKVDKPGR